VVFSSIAALKVTARTELKIGEAGVGLVALAVENEECAAFEPDAGRAVEIPDERAGGRETVQQRPAVAMPVHDGHATVVRHLRPAFGNDEIAARRLDDFARGKQTCRE
jgi:hypothetical protein